MFRYILFYKPYGVLSQFTPNTTTDPATGETKTLPQATLKDYIDIPNIYAVGRLDWDSEGLLLLTNDGRWQHRLSNPNYGHLRTYLVQVEGIPDDEAIESLCRGVKLRDYTTRSAKVSLLTETDDIPPRDPPIRDRRSIPTAWLELTLSEGKNRQVRRMTAAVGFPTLRLIRTQIDRLSLAGLEIGRWRELSRREIAELKR
jgi:23S rRNA pseudouridine2457 synthase